MSFNRECDHCGAPHGKPRLRDSTLDYSVSHTDHWLIMAVAGSGLLGADIESPASITNPDGLATTILTATEAQIYAQLPTTDRTAWLLWAWTRKEAAMKLTGLGLQAPPRQVDVSGPVVRADEVPRWPDRPIHLLGLTVPDVPDVPDLHVAALASTVPVATLRRFALPE
ncbi:4'-phosphopantetheinyl transferase family protein [Catenulispora rubra]|uniref:4'-phosphopantetheinyl transferase family protein n=1 Tax=Catenulispora rubra TaxID=280293 RepID=UPI0018920001|nr:4'-phosphopantetheinyl transferase superfamily protein [Catenulispora rubra]